MRKLIEDRFDMILNQSQTTIRKKVSFVGKGLHSGRIVILDVVPAEADRGIIFQRTDCPEAQPVKAHAHNIYSTRLNTTIGQGPSAVSTIEHLLAALAGLGIDNAVIKLNGPEVPILDGSARPFVKQLSAVGMKRLNRPQMVWRVKKPFEYKIDDQSIKILPSDRQRIKCSIDFQNKAIGFQSIDFRPTLDQFIAISQARTFCNFRDVTYMQQNGLALGGSLENAIVVDEDGVMNADGLRSPLEFVQHKLLDLIGDLSLLGAPLFGDIIAYKPGHHLHAMFMKEVLAHSDEILEPLTSHELLNALSYEDEAGLLGSALATFG